MALSRLQKVTNFDLAAVGTSFSGTLPSNVGPGNLIVVAFNIFNASLVSISDIAGNTYGTIGTATNGLDNSFLLYVGSAIAGSTIVTVNVGAVHVKSLGIYEYTGNPQSSVFDKFSFGSANASTNCSPGAMTPSQANSLIFSLGGDFVVGGTATVTAAPNYAIIDQQDDTNGERFYTEEFFQTTAAATTGSFTLANAANNRAIAAVFKPAIVAATAGWKNLMGVGA